MSVDSKEIELIIRANNQSKQTLDGVAKSISELNELIEAQGSASKKGQVGIDELKASLLVLQQTQDKLKSQANLVNQFEKSGEAAEKAADRVKRANEAFDKYSESKKDLGDNGEITEKRAAQLAKLEAAIVRAERAEAKRIETNQKLAVQLREAGIAEDNLEGAEAKLRQSAAELGLSIGRASTNIADYTKNLKEAQRIERERAEQENFAKTAADAAHLVKAGEYVNWWADALKKAEDSEKRYAAMQASESADTDRARRLQEEAAAFSKVSQEAAKLVKAGEYVNWWTEALKKQDAAQAAASNKEQLGRMADDAERMARTFTTLAGSAGEAQPKLQGLFTTLKGVADPAAEARNNLGGLIDQSRELAAAVDAINGPVKNYRETLQALDAVQKSAMQQGAAIDNYRQQMVAVRAARQEFVEARSQVTALAAAMRQADAPTAEMTADMRKAQSSLQGAATALRGTITAARDMRASLQQAGVDTRNLENTEKSLIGVVRQATQNVQDLSAAYKEHGAAVEKAHGSLKLFGGERTTLSLMQRLKGEVLALTAGYLGLQAAIGGAKSVLEATVEKQSMQNKLGIMTEGDQKAADAMYDRLHKQSVRIGMDFKEMGDSFTKFGLDAKESNMSMAQMEFAFNRITEAMRVQHADGVAVNGFFTQLGQMLNKGKVQMDDLRQASNHFQGFRSMMAKGLADINYQGIGKENPVGDMMEAMKKGSVDAGIAISAFAARVEKTYGHQIPEAMRSLQAEQGRFKTALFDFKQMVSDAGFGKAYTDFLAKINGMMDGPKAEEYAKTISDVLTKILDLLKVVMDNAGLIGDAFVLAFTLKASVAMLEFVANIPKLLTKIVEIKNGVLGLHPVLLGLGAVFAAVDAIIIAWQINKILYEKFSAVRQVEMIFVDSMLATWAMVKAGAQIAWEGIKGVFVEGFAGLMNLLTGPLRDMLRTVKLVAEAAHQDDMVARINLAIVQATVHTEGWASRMKNVRDIMSDAKKEVTGIYEILKQQLADEWNPPVEKPKPKKGDGDDTDNNPGLPKPAPTKPKEDKKRENLIQSIKNELETMQAELDKADKDNLEAQLRVFDERAQSIIDKIHKVGGAKAEEFAKKLRELIAKQKAETTEKYMEALDKEHDTAFDKFNKAADTNAKGFDAIFKAKLAEVQKNYREAFNELDKYEKKLRGSALPGKPVDQSKLDEVARAREQLQVSQWSSVDGAQKNAAKEAEAEQMKKVNELLNTRKELIDAVKIEEKAGMISTAESLEKQKAIISEMQPQIKALTDQILEMAKSWGLTAEQMDQLKARLTVATTSSDGLKKEMYSVKDAETDLANLGGSTMKAFTDGVGKAAVGAGTLGGAFRSAGQAFMKFAADFLMKIGEMIIQQQILNALGGGKGGLVAAGAGWLNGLMGGGAAAAGSSAAASGISSEAAMALFHSGGVVGQSGGMSRKANTSWFANAPKYHTGGVVGLSADEYPAILKKNEEVLTSDSPRNVLNGGNKSSAAPVKMPDIKVVNAIDSASVVQEGLSSTTGQKAFYNFMQANKSKIKTLLG